MLVPRAALLTLAIAGVAGLAGCGSGGSDDADAVEQVAQDVFGQKEKGAECTRSTARLVAAVWGTKAACLRKSTAALATDVSVSGTKVDGDRATTRIRTTIDSRKVSGGLDLRREDGDWRLDEFGTDLTRALLRGSLTAGYLQSLKDKGVKAPAGLLTDGSTERCVDAKVIALPVARQRDIGHAIVGNKAGSPEVKLLQDTLVDCMAATDTGREALRLAFEAGVRGEAKDARQADCVVARLRTTADSRLVAAEIARRQKSGGEVGQRITNLAAQAIGHCEKQSR